MFAMRTRLIRFAVLGIAIQAMAQTKPVNDLPSPYETVENYFKLPAGRMWGAISAIEVDKDGKSLWVAERCGANSGCAANPKVDPILLFDASGKLVRSFGAGMILSPHGIHVDRDGNIWVTDYADDAPRAARGAAVSAGTAAPATKGQQVLKFSPQGTLLMALGKPGGSREPDYFYQPNDVLTTP